MRQSLGVRWTRSAADARAADAQRLLTVHEVATADPIDETHAAPPALVPFSVRPALPPMRASPIWRPSEREMGHTPNHTTSNRVAVAPNRFSRGFDGSRTEVVSAYEVLELHDALLRTYSTDAHLVTYIVEGATRQPRINKPGLPFFPQPLAVEVFFCDVDNPGHAPWDDTLLSVAHEQYESLPILQTTGVYHTAHGRRFVQPLAEPIPVPLVEPFIRRWFLDLEQAGIAVDWACRDWTRHYRLPHVRRDGKPFHSPLVALERMRPVTLSPRHRCRWTRTSSPCSSKTTSCAAGSPSAVSSVRCPCCGPTARPSAVTTTPRVPSSPAANPSSGSTAKAVGCSRAPTTSNVLPARARRGPATLATP